MANDGKIYIIVTNQLPNGTPEPVPGAGTDKKEKEDKNTLESYIQHQFFHVIESQAKQAVSYTIGNIGNFTGDYVLQQHVQNVMSALGIVQNIGVAALAGAKFGPVGALVSAGVVAVGELANQGLQLFSGYLENTRQNRSIEMLRARAGLNSANNGSRGTDY